LASIVAAGYYRSSVVHPVFDLLVGLSGSLGLTPAVTGTNSGGTMFIVRYFALRDSDGDKLWTFPCYLLKTGYRSVCFLHGDFGAISEECYSENQNLIGAATAIIYGQLIMGNGGPLGVVASYVTVYFSFLNNLPISNTNYAIFWNQHSHWNENTQSNSDWSTAYTLVNARESGMVDGNTYNYGYDVYYSRGFRTSFLDASCNWYLNMSVYTIASISANTLTGLSMLPFAFAGKQWDSSSEDGAATGLKITGLLISFTMIK